MAVSDKPAVIVLTGASGAGKTTLLHKLADLKLPGVICINCDRVDLDLDRTLDSSDRQAAVLRHWIKEIRNREGSIKLAVLDAQIRPHRAKEVLTDAGIDRFEIVLVDCEPQKRNERLRTERVQPELVSHQMDCWATYLRGQADALKLPIIDTSTDSIESSLVHLLSFVNRLLKHI
jgi:dephospho-CoA kinase